MDMSISNRVFYSKRHDKRQLNYMFPQNNKINNEIEAYVKDMSFIIKKTHKIAVAATIISKCLFDNDPYKKMLRECSSNLLRQITNFSKKSTLEKEIVFSHIEVELSLVNQLVLALWSVGDVSEQSFSLMRDSINSILTDLEKNSIPYGESAFSISGAGSTGRKIIDDAWLQNSGTSISEKKYKPVNQKDSVSDIKDIHRKNETSASEPVEDKRHSSPEKQERINKIIDFIKDKKDVSVKDITAVVEGVADKTIQRDLASLIEKGYLKKVGKRRWARYVYLR